MGNIIRVFLKTFLFINLFRNERVRRKKKLHVNICTSYVGRCKPLSSGKGRLLKPDKEAMWQVSWEELWALA